MFLSGYVYLAVSIVLTTCFALCYKIAAVRSCEMRAVNLWMSVSATAVSMLFFLGGGLNYCSGAVALGVAAGVSTYVSVLSYFYYIRTGNLAVSWTVIGLAVAFPVVASIVVWHEQPTARQCVGLGLIVMAFVLFGAKKVVDR